MASSSKEPFEDIFPLRSVDDVFPADVDMRLTSYAPQSQLYVGLCQMVKGAE